MLVKSQSQLEGIRESGKINTAVLDYVEQHIRAGISTEEIDRWVHKTTTDLGAVPAPLNFEGFPKSVCTSRNLSDKKRLVRVAREAVRVGLLEVKPWKPIGDMGHAIHMYVGSQGYSVVEDIGGHGVGLQFHEDPWVSYVAPRGSGEILVPGMVFTIEPMINMGSPDFYVDDSNGWTVYTEDGMPSAQWEVTVAVT